MKDLEKKIEEAGISHQNQNPNNIGAGLSFMIGAKSLEAKAIYHTDYKWQF